MTMATLCWVGEAHRLTRRQAQAQKMGVSSLLSSLVFEVYFQHPSSPSLAISNLWTTPNLSWNLFFNAQVDPPSGRCPSLNTFLLSRWSDLILLGSLHYRTHYLLEYACWHMPPHPKLQILGDRSWQSGWGRKQGVGATNVEQTQLESKSGPRAGRLVSDNFGEDSLET